MERKRGKEQIPLFNTEKDILKAFYELLTGIKLLHSNQPPLAHNDIKVIHQLVVSQVAWQHPDIR